MTSRCHISSAVTNATTVAKAEEVTAMITLFNSDVVQLGSEKKLAYQFIEGSWGGKAICRGPLNDDPSTTMIGVYRNTARPVRESSLAIFNGFSAENEVSNSQTQQHCDKQTKRQSHRKGYVEGSHKVSDEYREHPV